MWHSILAITVLQVIVFKIFVTVVKMMKEMTQMKSPASSAEANGISACGTVSDQITPLALDLCDM